jgi:hypothetical protein
MKRLISAFAIALLSTSAFAQSVPLQGGPWTPGHVPMYSVSGGSQPIVQDSGTAGGGPVGLGLLEILQVSQAANGITTAPYGNSGNGPLKTHNCFYDAPVTSANGYHYLCLDANAQGGGLLAYGAGGGATALPLQFSINGVAWSPLSGTLPLSATTPLSYNNATGVFSLNVGAGLTTSGGQISLANPSASTLGGIISASGASNQFMTGVSTSGIPSFAPTHVATNSALKGLTAGVVPTVIRDGYASAGDGGAAYYVWSGSNCSNADNGAQVSPNVGTGCWIAEFTGYPDIRVWGAIPSQGSSVDVGPNVRAACAYSATNAVRILAPAGSYYLNTLDSSTLGAIVYGNGLQLTAGCSIKGLGNTNQVDTDESSYSSTYLAPVFILGPGLNRPLIYVGPRAPSALWEDVVLDGNNSAQTGWVGGPGGKLYTVQVVDLSYWAQNTSYGAFSWIQDANGVYYSRYGGTSANSGTGPSGTGGNITDGTISWAYAGPPYETGMHFSRAILRGGYNGNLYLGAGRGTLFMRDSWVMYSGQTTSDSAIMLYGYDSEFFNVNVGVNTGNGYYFASGSQYQVTDGAVFINGAAGIVINGNYVPYLLVENTNIQHNGTNGISVLNGAGYIGQPAGIHAYSNVTFDENSWNGTGTYSDVLINGSSIERFSNPNFLGSSLQSGTYSIPKYNVEFSSCGFASISGPSFGTGTSSTLGFSNRLDCLQTNANQLFSWTPVLAGSTVAGTPTYTLQKGYWQRAGNFIEVHFNLTTSALGGPTGNLIITGLPKASSNASGEQGQCSIQQYSGWTADAGFTTLTGLVVGNSTSVQLWESGSGKTYSQATPVSDYAAATTISGDCRYFVDN